jgi:predicted Zn-ribbon and HTH transcriptional regulator
MYDNRFSDLEDRKRIWKILTSNFFQKYINKNDTVLDYGSGYCEFINNISCKIKFAYDTDKSLKKYANKNVRFLENNKFPVNINKIFISNVFEHMEKVDIIKTVEKFYTILKKGGQVLVLQPNIRFCHKDYWMFFDHITPIDDRALEEIFQVFEFKTVGKILRFLPYTTKNEMPKHSFLIKAYLHLPFIWNIFGQQSFLVFEK